MNWKKAVERAGILTDDALADLDRGLHVALSAADLQAIVDFAAAIEQERCAEVAEYGFAQSDPGPYNNACRNIAAAIRGGK